MNEFAFTVKHEVSIDGAAILSWLRARRTAVAGGIIAVAELPLSTGLTPEEIQEAGDYLISFGKLAVLQGNWRAGHIAITPAGLQSLTDYEGKNGRMVLPISRRKLGHGFRINGNAVYYRHSEIRYADPATFEVLNHIWVRDAKRVYCQSSKMRANRATFRLLNEIYATDEEFIFYGTAAAKWIDTSTFQVLDKGIYANPGAGNDVIHCGYARDKENVFFCDFMSGKPRYVRGANPGSFRSIQYRFGADDQKVFWEERRLPGADPATFTILSELYCKDKSRVYFTNRPIAEADAATFEIIPPVELRPIFVRARDRHSVFDGDKRV